MIALSALASDGVAGLEPYLAPATTIALVGSSGVGKSTIVNRLLGRELQKVASIRQSDGTGRHTTTTRQLFALLVGMVTADTLTAKVKERPEEHYRDRVLLPEDISAADHGLLVAVQQTIDKVTDARVELGGSGGSDTLDTARGLSVLHEQEWRIACLLARQRELRREHIRRWQQASSPRVREVLEPQRRHLIAVEGHIRARVDQIVEYGRLVEASVLAHREWEQCQEALDSMDAYTDLRTEASLMSVRSAEVAELADTAEVARRVRDESVARVHTAVTGLMELPQE